jgi:hypothetical protein
VVTLLLTTSIRSFAHSDVSVQYWIEPTLIVDPWSTLQAEQNLTRFLTRDCTEVGGGWPFLHRISWRVSCLHAEHSDSKLQTCSAGLEPTVFGLAVSLPRS